MAATAPAADRGVVSTRPPPPRKLWALTSCIRYPMLRNKLPQNPAAERKRVSFWCQFLGVRKSGAAWLGFSDLRSLKRLRSNYEPRLQSSEGLMGQKDPPPSWLSDMAGKFMLAPSRISTGLLECPWDMAGGFLRSS